MWVARQLPEVEDEDRGGCSDIRQALQATFAHSRWHLQGHFPRFWQKTRWRAPNRPQYISDGMFASSSSKTIFCRNFKTNRSRTSLSQVAQGCTTEVRFNFSKSSDTFPIGIWTSFRAEFCLLSELDQFCQLCGKSRSSKGKRKSKDKNGDDEANNSNKDTSYQSGWIDYSKNDSKCQPKGKWADQAPDQIRYGRNCDRNNDFSSFSGLSGQGAGTPSSSSTLSRARTSSQRPTT